MTLPRPLLPPVAGDAADVAVAAVVGAAQREQPAPLLAVVADVVDAAAAAEPLPKIARA